MLIATVSFNIYLFQILGTISANSIILTTSHAFLRWEEPLVGHTGSCCNRPYQQGHPTLRKPKENQDCRHLTDVLQTVDMLQALSRGNCVPSYGASSGLDAF